MCVKEFFGFICGHCSIPTIRQCPLATQNIEFPICSLPAERPTQTQDYCHGCARALWNMRVLNEEAKHKLRHEQSTCACEFIFTDDERRMRDAAMEGSWEPAAPNRSQSGMQTKERYSGHSDQLRREGHIIQQGWSKRDDSSAYLGYLIVDDKCGERQYYNYEKVENRIQTGRQSMNWHPQQHQYHAMPFKNMVFEVQAVSNAGKPGGVLKNPSLSYPQNMVRKKFAPSENSIPTPDGTYAHNSKAQQSCVQDRRSQLMVEEGVEGNTRTSPSSPMVVSSSMYQPERPNSAPPQQSYAP